MNRTETEAAISGYLPRRARRRLPAIMAAVDAHAAAEREDLDRVAAEGARRQKLVAEEFQAVKAERDELATELRNLNSAEGSARAEAAELGKQVRVLVEERAAALAEGNRLRQQATALENELNTALAQARSLLTESDKLRDAYQLAWTERNQARDELTTANADRKGLAAERDRLREQLAAMEASQKAEAEMTVPSPGEIVAGLAGPNTLTVGPGAPVPAPGGDAAPPPRPRTRAARVAADGPRKPAERRTPPSARQRTGDGTEAPRDADGGAA